LRAILHLLVDFYYLYGIFKMNLLFKNAKRSTMLGLSVLLAYGLVACGGGNDTPAVATTKITLAAIPALAISPVTSGAATASLTAVSTGFTFAAVPAFGTTAATTVKFTAPAAGTTTPLFAIASGSGTASGNMSYGSCKFNVTASTLPGLIVGATITIDPCSFAITTAGQVTTQGATSNLSTTSTLQLGTLTSSPATIVVSVTNVNGVNTVNVGSVAVGTVTGTVNTGASN
jgi:hypothetical protein